MFKDVYGCNMVVFGGFSQRAHSTPFRIFKQKHGFNPRPTVDRDAGQLILPSEVANGILGALVSITATCASVHTHSALLIGFVGALVGLSTNDMLLS